MTSRLSNDTLAQLTPLLGSLARLIARGSALGDAQLHTLLVGADLESEAGALEELKRWGKLLSALRAQPSEESRQATVEALVLRGVPEAPVLLAVATVADRVATAVRQPSAPSSSRLRASVPSLDLGVLPSGRGGSAEFEVEGGPGQIVVESVQLVVTPQDFGPAATRVRVDVRPMASGVLWTALKLVTGGETLEVPVVAQWDEPSATPRPTLDSMPRPVELVRPAEPSGPGRPMPYTLYGDRIANNPGDLPRVCDADWDRAVDHFAKGHIARWLRESIAPLRAWHQHGPADDFEEAATRAEGLLRRLQGAGAIARHAALEEFLESLGASAPVPEVTPTELDLAPVGVGELGEAVTVTVSNRSRGYLSGSAISRVSWLRASPEKFGCKGGEQCVITVTPDMSGLDAGPIWEAEALRFGFGSSNFDVAVRSTVLGALLSVAPESLDLAPAGAGEAGEPVSLTISNQGHGYLAGSVIAKVPWLRVVPGDFKCPASEQRIVSVSPDLTKVKPGILENKSALRIESNGGHQAVSARIEVLPPLLKVSPERLVFERVGAGEIAQPLTLAISNGGRGTLTGEVVARAGWLQVKPDSFRLVAGAEEVIQVVAGRAGKIPGLLEECTALEIESDGGSQIIAAQIEIVPTLLVSPLRLEFGTVEKGESGRPVALRIGNRGREPLRGTVVAKVPWLRIEQGTFWLSSGKEFQTGVVPALSQLEAGIFESAEALRIESSGGDQVVGASAQILGPILTVLPQAVDLGGLELRHGASLSTEVRVSNSGSGMLEVSVHTAEAWLRPEPATFTCQAGSVQAVCLSVIPGKGLRLGDLKQTVRLVSNGGTHELVACLQVRLGTGQELEWIRIPAGKFFHRSGSWKKHAPMPEYFLTRTPVTNAQYEAFVWATGHRPPKHWAEGRIPRGKEDHPVVWVSYHDAAAFCRWAGCRLPTSKEWEKGARGTDGRRYPWGEMWEDGRCNSREAGIWDTTAVASFPGGASPYGLLDMAGNVWEWCEDSDDRIRGWQMLRGGSWFAMSDAQRSLVPEHSDDDVGFRCAVSTQP